MYKDRKIILSCIIVFISLLSNNSVIAQPLLMGFNESTAKPYKWFENEEYVGAWIDIIQIVAERSGVEIQLKPLPLKRLFLYLQGGEIDGAFGIYRESDRDKNYIFLDTPIGWSTTYAFVKKGNDFIFNHPEDLYGKQIGVLRGLSFGPELNNEIKKQTLMIQNVSSYEQNILKLLADRIDVTFAPGQCFKMLINDMGLSGQINILPLPVTPQRSVHIIFSKAANFSNKNETIKTMELILREMADNGELDIITKKHGYNYIPY